MEVKKLVIAVSVTYDPSNGATNNLIPCRSCGEHYVLKDEGCSKCDYCLNRIKHRALALTA